MADDGQLASAGMSAAQGAMAGAALGPWGIAGGAALGLGTSLLGGAMGANAASKAARAQQEAAARWKQYISSQQDSALSALKNPSDMAAYDQALTAQKSNVQRMQTLAQSLDPNLAEVGKQLHGMLLGQSAPILDNLKQQRSVQRQQLVDRMNQQMGPGGQTSTAGMQALNQFDQDTSNQLAQAQDQHISQFLNVSLQSPGAINQLGGANSQLGDLVANGPGAKEAQLRAQFTGAAAGAAQADVNSAGGQFIGQQMQGQMLGQLGGAIIQGVGAYAGHQSLKTGAPGGATGTLGRDLSGGPTAMGNNPNDSLGLFMPQGVGPAGFGAGASSANQASNYGSIPPYLRANGPMQAKQPYDALGGWRGNAVGMANQSITPMQASGFSE